MTTMVMNARPALGDVRNSLREGSLRKTPCVWPSPAGNILWSVSSETKRALWTTMRERRSTELKAASPVPANLRVSFISNRFHPPQGHHAGEDRVRQATGHGVPADVPLINVLAHALVRVRGLLSSGDERVQQEF